MLLLVGCGTNAATCPTSASEPLPTCGADTEGLQCMTLPAAGSINQRTNDCGCSDNRWSCNDCPGHAAGHPTGSCVPTDFCDWGNFEFDCSCNCTAAGVWMCSGIDDQGICSTGN